MGESRIEPPQSARTADFWRGGADGELRIARCEACGHYVHPPQPVCPVCRDQDVRPRAVSGRGVVHSFTVSRVPWTAQMPPPYVVAEVDLVEQDGLRLLTNVVGCEPDMVAIGMKVKVCFVRAGDAYIPLFAPVEA